MRDQVGNRWDLRGKMGVVTGCEACTIEGPACSPSTQDWLNFHRATQHNSKIVTPAIHKISREDPFMYDEKLELRSIIERAILGRNVCTKKYER